MKAAGRCGRIGSSPKIIDRGTDSVLLAAVVVIRIGIEKGVAMKKVCCPFHSKMIGISLTVIEKERTNKAKVLCYVYFRSFSA